MDHSVFCTIVGRVAYLVALSIIFYRVNLSWATAENNLTLLTDQEYFHPFSERCGDPLNVLNIAQADSDMK